MASTQKATVFQVLKTNKSGSKVAVSSHRGAEVTAYTPQRGHGYISSSQRGPPVSLSPSSHRRSEAAYLNTHCSNSDYPRSLSPQSGPGLSTMSTPRGTETRPRTEASRHRSPHRKNQSVQTQTYHLSGGHRNVSPLREESTRRCENKPGRDPGYHSSLATDGKYRHLIFISEKEEDPPSKVQNPQGVRVPRRISIHPKDEAIQTEPTRRIAEVKSSRNVSEHGNRVTSDHQAILRKTPTQEPEIGPPSSILSEPKQKAMKVSSGLKLSVLRDLDGAPRVPLRSDRSVYIENKPSSKVLISEMEPTVRSPNRDRESGRKVTISPGKQSVQQSPHRVTVRAAPEGHYRSPLYSELSPKPSTHAELELTPRPLPPRSLPRYGPGCSWWALLNPKVETPPNQPSVFDFEPTSPPPLDPLESFFEMDSNPFCEDLVFQREKVSLPCSPKESLHRVPLTEVPKTLKYTNKQPIQGFNAFFLDVSEEMYNRILWWLKDEEIKHFLEDSSDDAELSKFVKDFPGGEPCHPSEAKTRVPRPQISEPRPQSPELCDDDLEFRASLWPQPSESQQYFCAPAPLSPSSRPRSPWGKLDPYDSSEDDKEYVGFATLPNQVHRKSVKKGFDFTLMVAGESGLGKSTLVNSLFLTDLYRDRKLLGAEERIMQTVEITKHAVDIEEKGVRLRLTIVDTPGFGDAVNNTECWKPVAEYIDQQFEQYFRDESGLNRKNIQDNRVHCCLYFISPFGHGLRPLDVEFMKALHQRVNIVPILAKADTLTPPEVDRKKCKIREEIEHFGIKIYQFPDCDSDEDEDFKLQDQALKESIPFAVIGSNTVVEARGRRVRGRLYPWGIVEVENPGHCDFVKLRTMLVRTHMQDLKDVTRETHYENYRAQCIQSMTRLVVKERNRNKLTRESGTDFPIPAVPPGTDPETEKLIREKDEELRRMQEMLHKIQRQMKETH
ncbi:septin-4 isoform X4 [Phodopus roborovskii]|uniref:septin-4 isoform X4 n=1 Tax=Phodopus roborovskii TaxID=109678 RepID=UPI0021E4870F|nr:septin-4 isoform X4 [Phodopus roborovskii]